MTIEDIQLFQQDLNKYIIVIKKVEFDKIHIFSKNSDETKILTRKELFELYPD